MQPSSNRHGLAWFIFSMSALAGIGLFFIPAFIIRPFAHQTPSALALAMALRQRAPWATLLAAFVCAIFTLVLWRAADWDDSNGRFGRKGKKTVLASVMVLVAFSAVMARLNYFEWMFHPVDSPQFESAAASKLDKGEMILAVREGPDARAYPISEMAYHHVLNDVVEGVPVAVTY